MNPEDTTRFEFNYEELGALHSMVMDSRQLNTVQPVASEITREILADHDRWIARLDEAMEPYEAEMEGSGF